MLRNKTTFLAQHFQKFIWDSDENRGSIYWSNIILFLLILLHRFGRIFRIFLTKVGPKSHFPMLKKKKNVFAREFLLLWTYAVEVISQFMDALRAARVIFFREIDEAN